MSEPIVDLAIVEIDYSGGSKELQTVMSIDVQLSDPKRIVKTMRRSRRALGRTRGVPDYSANVKFVYPVGKPEIDLEALLLSGEEFQMVYQESSDGQTGRRFSCVDCAIDDLSKPFNQDGNTEVTAKITMIDHFEE